MRLFVSIIFCALSLLLIQPLHANEVGEKIKKKYSSLTSVHVVFTTDNASQKTVLKAKKGNMFVLDNGANIVYCNGKTVWNYNKAANKCMISSRDIHSESTSLDELFLKVISTYTVDKVMTINDSKTGNGYILVLKPSSTSSEINGIKSINVIVDKKNLILKQLVFTDGTGAHKITISSIKTNPPFSDDTFTFTPPKNASVIDMR